MFSHQTPKKDVLDNMKPPSAYSVAFCVQETIRKRDAFEFAKLFGTNAPDSALY